MITKNQVKNISYIDRDSNAEKIVDNLFARSRDEMITFIQEKINNLQGKEAGEYYTTDLILKVMNREVDNMRAFYKGAVIPYYCRQMKDFWEERIPSKLLDDCDKEIKKHVGYILYDTNGNPTDETNSITNFTETKEFMKFLTDVENVCFKDSEILFPDSEHYRELEKYKGREVARWQAYQELKAWYKNQFNEKLD
jgi:hypothetical protein